MLTSPALRLFVPVWSIQRLEGSIPCLATLTKGQSVFGCIELQAVIRRCFNALLQLYGDSMEAKAKIFDMVVGDNVSKRLKEEGVLWLDL